MEERPADTAHPPGLAAFFEGIAPFLLGEEGVDRAKARLYPGREDSADAQRLVIYGRFCRSHRHQVLDGVYGDLRRLVVQARGEAAWDALVEAYFRAHPMFHPELNENGAHLTGFLHAHQGALGLPTYTAALADLLWWTWRTRVAPDDPADATPGEGPLRIASTVELRPCAWDLCAWLDEADEESEPSAPEARAVYTLFWRDLDGATQRREASVMELFVLKAVMDGEVSPTAGVDPVLWSRTLADLRAAGVLLGGCGAPA